MWYHYKEDRLIGIMKWDSLPTICHKWWKRCQKSYNMNKEELVFVDGALKDTNSFDYQDTCQMPHCMQFCDEYIKDIEGNTEYGKDYDEYNTKRQKDMDNDVERAYPRFSKTDKYLKHLRIYLNKLREDLIKHPDRGFNEYIIYKEREVAR